MCHVARDQPEKLLLRQYLSLQDSIHELFLISTFHIKGFNQKSVASEGK